MILIFSNANDVSTDRVIDWLLYFERKFIRINESDFFDFIRNISLSNEGLQITFTYEEKKIALSEITAVWFRRHLYSSNQIYEKKGGKNIYIKSNKDGQGILVEEINRLKIKNNIEREFKVVRDYVFYVLQKCPRVLGHWRENHENKLRVLDCAVSVGLSIPNTDLLTSKKELLAKHVEERELITKSLSYAPSFVDDELIKPIANYTAEVNIDQAKEYADHFFWSLIQKKINKVFEIRVFYLNKKFYSMAIFSQQSSKTRMDFRQYDWNTPNRCVPYLLPSTIESKLGKLMELLQLNTGSIDLIFNENHEYVFLEVNPVGQFGMVSSPCNYYLEKEIARFLTA